MKEWKAEVKEQQSGVKGKDMGERWDAGGRIEGMGYGKGRKGRGEGCKAGVKRHDMEREGWDAEVKVWDVGEKGRKVRGKGGKEGVKRKGYGEKQVGGRSKGMGRGREGMEGER